MEWFEKIKQKWPSFSPKVNRLLVVSFIAIAIFFSTAAVRVVILKLAGTYSDVQFRASDASLSDYENITILVNNTNQAPILNTIGTKTVKESSLLSFVISATDAEGDNLT